MNKLLVVFLGLAGFVESSAGAVHTVYFEDFDHYAPNVPVFSPGAQVIETESGTVVCFEYTTNRVGVARQGFFPVKTPPTAQDWTFAFEFLFGRDEKMPQEFELLLFFGDPAHPEPLKLLVSETGSRFAGGSSLYKPKDGDSGFLQNLVAGPWLGFKRGVLTVHGREAAFHVFRGGRQVVDCRGLLPEGRLVGWNAGFSRENGGEVRLDRVTVTDGETRPYRTGDVQDVLAGLLDRPPEQMPRDFGRPLGGSARVPVDLAKDAVHFKFRPGAGGDLRLRLLGPDGRPCAVFGLNRRDERDVVIRSRRYAAATGVFTNVVERPVFAGEYFVGGSGWFPWIYTRPRLRDRYRETEKAEFFAVWDRLPKPGDRVFDIVLKRIPTGEVEEWIDGNFVQAFTNVARMVTVSAVVPEGGELRAALEPLPDGDPFDVVLPLPKDGFKLARNRTHAGIGGLGESPYLSRSAFDAMPSDCLFSVPTRQYARVRARVKVDPDAPADAVPEIRARLTSYTKSVYHEGRASEAIAESAPVTVERGGVRDVVLDLPVGDILDLTSLPDAFDAKGRPVGQLDIEFVGPTLEKDEHVITRRREIDDRRPSSVIVLSATLEASPVQFAAEPFDSHSVYYPNEEAGATITTRQLSPGACSVTVTVADMSGRILQNETFAAGDDMTRRVVFGPRELGTYAVTYRVGCGDGKPFFTHRATFARVTDAPRQAGAASPYYRWTWWGGYHGTARDFSKTAAAMRKLGVLKGILNRQGPRCKGIPETNETAKALGVYNAQFPYTLPRIRPGEKDEDVVRRLVAEHRKEIAEYPNCRTALIFHESSFFPQAFPRELLGERTVLTDAEREAQDRAVREAVLSARAWRETDPGVRLIWGSSNDSIALLGQCFRGGVPREYVDAVSEETVGYATPPELSSVRPAWLLRDLARACGYGEIRSDDAFEWKTRVTRFFRDEEQMAAWTVRDGLIALALGYSLVHMGGCTDVADSYGDTHWGSGGPFARWPLAYPRRLAAAEATMTSVLDGARFVRHLATGSPTAYACEFVRPDGRTVTAVWTARGETLLDLDLGGNPDYGVTELEGAAKTGLRASAFDVGETPRYLLTAKPLAAARVRPGSRRYPHEVYSGSEHAEVVQALAEADEVALSNARDIRMDEPDEWMNWRRPGDFALAAVMDDEKGACLELTDRTPPHAQKLMMNYTFLRFSKTRPASGRPTTIGVWVKGNSSWGRLLFEVTDAEGEVWLTTGPGGVCCDTQDWACQAAVDFDGWHFVQFPLTKESPVRVEGAGDNEWQWTRDGNGNGRIDYPVRISGLGYMAPQYAIDIDTAVKVGPSIRLKDVSAY